MTFEKWLRFGDKITAILIAAAFLSVASWSIVRAQAAEDNDLISVVAKLRPSVGALYAQQQDGDLSFLCSATAVGREGPHTIILTAYHCMRKGVSYLINFGDNTLRPLRVWKIPHYEVDDQKHPRRFNEPMTDAALMLMQGHDIPIAPFAGSSSLAPGSSIATVGYPLGVAKIAYEGIVAGRFDRLGADMYDYLLLQIFGAPGSSGSAVVSVKSGEVIGVLVAGKQAGAGLPVIFATPVEYRKHLMMVLPDTEAGNAEDEKTPSPASQDVPASR